MPSLNPEIGDWLIHNTDTLVQVDDLVYVMSDLSQLAVKEAGYIVYDVIENFREPILEDFVIDIKGTPYCFIDYPEFTLICAKGEQIWVIKSQFYKWFPEHEWMILKLVEHRIIKLMPKVLAERFGI